MPYGSISLKTAWMIFWNIYCKDQLAVIGGANQPAPPTGSDDEEGPGGQRARVMSPTGVEDIRDAIRGSYGCGHALCSCAPQSLWMGLDQHQVQSQQIL